MSDVIQLLPDSVANQIAAGEVIQRPANVIKELVENSVDAGATVINVIVVDAGRTLIQVIDNGKGMSETDARMSFERHATSKIRHAGDLFDLHTMGFRGEALASIAAVAQVELKTRQEKDDIGTHLSITGSTFTGQEPCSCPVGTNFLIENLFFNVPARRKFLKSNYTELNNVIAAFERIVLVYPEISFTLHSNGTELYNLKGGGLRQRIVDVFGKKINQELLQVGVDTTVCAINGFVGKPESARKKGARQFFFVNRRYMRHAYFNKAVATAFDRLIPVGEQVPYFIYFRVPAEDIDVNIHPTKTEIKFENEQAIWQILSASVKEAIGVFNEVPSIDFDTEGKPDIPVFDPSKGSILTPTVSYNPRYNPFKDRKHVGSVGTPDQWEQLYNGLKRQGDAEATIFGDTGEQGIISEKSPIHYQYKGKYIMTSVKSGLMIVDQHRAHVRILYERYVKMLDERVGSPQKTLFPEIVQLTTTEQITLRKILSELTDIGFELTDLGDGNYAINAVPAGLEGINTVRLVKDMLISATEQGNEAMEKVNQSLAISMARGAAIPQGQVLNNDEMEGIMNELFACSNTSYTPTGNKILCILKQTEIEHLLS